MKITFLDNQKNLLNDFVDKFSPRSFLQTYQWGEFQERMGKKIWRLGIFDNEDNLRFVASIVLEKMPIKSYLYCPFGPIWDSNLSSDLIKLKSFFKFFLKEVRKIAKREGSIFLKIDPPILKDNQKIRILFKELFFKKSLKKIQPEKVWVLDIKESEDKILKKMKAKTRYNIRLAKKRGVEILEGGISDFEVFFNLLKQTAKRNDFHLHPRKYYFEMLKFFQKNKETDDQKEPFVKLFLAKFNNKTVAANLVLFFSGYAIYLHGGFNYSFRKFMPTFLLHWEIIKTAKKLNCYFYDFWGIDEENKNWQGFTRFKKSFGGEAVNYLGAYDFVFNPVFYQLYKIILFLKKF